MVNCELNSEPVFASLLIKKLSTTQRNRVSLQFTERVFGIYSVIFLKNHEKQKTFSADPKIVS